MTDLASVIQEFADRVEVDRREPDKLLCHVLWARRIAFDAMVDGETDKAEVIEATMNAQAELQTGLGFLRLHLSEYGPINDLGIIEDRLAKSLALSHKLLAALGNPMYDPATHPEV